MPDRIVKVLFICVHNSGRSQMAEALLESIDEDRFEVESAGFDPRPINPLVVQVMAEIGLDLANRKSKRVYDFFREGRLFDYVITVCDESSEHQCPIFPGIVQRLNWPFPDPAALEGTEAEKLSALRQIRDQIKRRIESWVAEQP